MDDHYEYPPTIRTTPARLFKRGRVFSVLHVELLPSLPPSYRYSPYHHSRASVLGFLGVKHSARAEASAFRPPCYPGPRMQHISEFSSGVTQYFVKGDANGRPLEALPDSGASMCCMSEGLASDLGLEPAPRTQKSIRLANQRHVQSPGMVEVSWKFEAEERAYKLSCWILPGCIHDLILGNEFLKSTQTLGNLKNQIDRIQSRLVDLPNRLRLRLMSDATQRLAGRLDGHPTAALPDTGSDVMLISGAYARKLGLAVDDNIVNRNELEFADGTVTRTSGIARSVRWSVGRTTVRCDFHVLDELNVDVVLSKNYLFKMNIFTKHTDSLCDITSDDISQLCNIRLIGRYSDTLNYLEEEYLEDVTSPDAFGPQMVQRELARRDQIRDQVSALPVSRRQAAAQAEAERQRRWQELRRAHMRRRESASSPLRWFDAFSNTHRTEMPPDPTQHLNDRPAEGVDHGNGEANTSRTAWWKRKQRTLHFLHSLRRSRTG